MNTGDSVETEKNGFRLWCRAPRARAVAWIALLAVSASFGCSAPGGVPSELIGHWETMDARYEGRAFAITDSTLTIFTDPTERSVYEITGVQQDNDDGPLVITIEYEQDGEAFVFRLGLGPSGSGGPDWIYPAEQPEVEWRRALRS